MAYHIACPITCRKICYCRFGESSPATTSSGSDAAVVAAASASGNLNSNSSSVSASAAWRSLSLRVQEVAGAGAASRAEFPWHVLPYEAGRTVDVVVPSLVKDVKKNKRRNPADSHRQQQQRNAGGGAGRDATPGKKSAVKGGGGGGKAGVPAMAASSGGDGGASAADGAAASGSRTNALRTTKKFGGGGSSTSVKFRFNRPNPNADAKTVARSFVLGGAGNSPRPSTEPATDAAESPHGRHGGGQAPSRFTPAAEENSREQTAQASRLPCELCVAPIPDLTNSKGNDVRMISCSGCGKQYHRMCVQRWAENRDVFDWRAWRCPTCRSCEVCRQAGEANKLMMCKRCDNALHIYCQQPPLKHVPKGPYLCPKHTVCHSCGSNVPGSGMSSKWFMSFTTCDACGRLFAKDKYCPVCLKVYRDSESKPMVRCDSCEHWVHCQCDGIGDELFGRFQSDDDLQYECKACRGECPKVNNIEDAVRELWRRRDEADAVQRSKLGAAGGATSARDHGRDGGQQPSSEEEEDDSKDVEMQERGGREAFTGQRNNLKRPRGKSVQKSQKRSEQRQRLLSSVALQT